jgi:hypothetical protein
LGIPEGTGTADGRGKMHQERDRAEDALGVVDEADQLTQIGLAAQIDGIAQWLVLVPVLANLDEKNVAGKMIDDALIPLVVPPLDGEIALAAGHHDPEGYAPMNDFLDLRDPGHLLCRDIKIAAKLGRLDCQLKFLVEVVDKAVQKVIRRMVAAMDQRIVAMYHLDAAISFA